MSFTTEDVREILREHGPLTRAELEGRLGLEEGEEVFVKVLKVEEDWE